MGPGVTITGIPKRTMGIQEGRGKILGDGELDRLVQEDCTADLEA